MDERKDNYQPSVIIDLFKVIIQGPTEVIVHDLKPSSRSPKEFNFDQASQDSLGQFPMLPSCADLSILCHVLQKLMMLNIVGNTIGRMPKTSCV